MALICELMDMNLYELIRGTWKLYNLYILSVLLSYLVTTQMPVLGVVNGKIRDLPRCRDPAGLKIQA